MLFFGSGSSVDVPSLRESSGLLQKIGLKVVLTADYIDDTFREKMVTIPYPLLLVQTVRNPVYESTDTFFNLEIVGEALKYYTPDASLGEGHRSQETM